MNICETRLSSRVKGGRPLVLLLNLLGIRIIRWAISSSQFLTSRRQKPSTEGPSIGPSDYGPGPAYIGVRGIRAREEVEIGGFTLREETAPDGPLVLLYSLDLDTSMEAVREAGGELVIEPYDFPGGRRFHFRDPSGNELGVWSTQ